MVHASNPQNHARRQVGLVLLVLISAATLSTGPIRPALVQADAGTWSYTGSLNTPRYFHTETLLPDGKILVAGGGNISGGVYHILDSAELYDPVTGTWNATGTLNVPRTVHTSTLLKDGTILIVGGVDGRSFGGSSLNSAELYNPKEGNWNATGSLNTPRYGHTATLLQNGKVLVAGGGEIIDWEETRWLDTVELYDPDTGLWSFTDNLNTTVDSHTATLLQDGKVLFLGPWGNSAELYDPDTGTWSSVATLVGNIGFGHTATLLPDGRVLVVGGEDPGGLLNAAHLYEPNIGVWSSIGPLNRARRNHTATLLPDGKVLVAGGTGFRFSGGITSYVNLAESELYDPDTGAWSFTGDLNNARSYHTATHLADGKVLLTGGLSDQPFPNFLDSAELYESDTVNCDAQISPTNQFVSSMGGAVLVNLATGNACSWAVSNNVDWIILTSPGTGTGPDAVTFEVRENFASSPRSTTLVIAGQNFIVVQDGSGAGCDYSLSARFQTFSATGGTAAINVSTGSQCAWQAVSNEGWIVITSNGIGVGNGVMSFSVAANPTESGRKGAINVAGQIFSVKQKGN